MSSMFDPIVPYEQLHPGFAHVYRGNAFHAARQIMDKMFANFIDCDGNFLQQFQTAGFDARTFEYYMYVTLRELGFTFDRTWDRPDFVASKDGHDIILETTTANPSSKLQALDEELEKYDESSKEADTIRFELINEFMPIAFGSALYSKLKKEYWRLPHCANKPIIIAIQAFNLKTSLQYSDNALHQYLYGLRTVESQIKQGMATSIFQKIDTHQTGQKAPIPSGYFEQPGSENISAVIFSNSGTLPKFNRMGHQDVSMRHPNVRMAREGLCYDHNPMATKPKPFFYEVGDGSHTETWQEGLMMFLNPNAKHPIDPKLLNIPCVWLLGDDLASNIPGFHPFKSVTATMLNS